MLKRRGWLTLGAIAVWAMASAAAQAQDAPLSEREKELLTTIDALKERLTQLEERMDTMAAPDVEVRLTEVEKAVEQKTEADAKDFRVYWKDSLRFETNDGNIKLRIGGRIHNDWVWYSQDEDLEWIGTPKAPVFVDLEDGVEFRRARIYLSGEVGDNVEFKAQYDFAGGAAAFKDVYVGLTNVPYVGGLRVGQFKEPFSLDELTSSNDITFMERALPNVFAPSRQTGLMVHGTALEERMTYAAGVFKSVNDYGNGYDDGTYAYTARVTGLPWYEDEGRQLIHLGAAYSVRNPDDPIRYRQRPEVHGTSTRFVDTGNMWADDVQLFGLEAAGVYGPLSLQAEYIRTDVDSPLVGDRTFDGWYAYVSYFLTGEHRAYKTSEGAFTAIKPKNNFGFGEDGGSGAWELALRYSTLDLNDGNFLRGGEEDNITAAVNWYLNPNAKVKFEYVRADIDHDLYAGDLDIFQTRFQFSF
jgi:phosphate-selective porin OprO/OprP